MVLEGAVAVGSVSILTISITKLKCYAKKNGPCNYGAACMDKPILDDDDVSVKSVEMDGVHLYMLLELITITSRKTANMKC